MASVDIVKQRRFHPPLACQHTWVMLMMMAGGNGADFWEFVCVACGEHFDIKNFHISTEGATSFLLELDTTHYIP